MPKHWTKNLRARNWPAALHTGGSQRGKLDQFLGEKIETWSRTRAAEIRANAERGTWAEWRGKKKPTDASGQEPKRDPAQTRNQVVKNESEWENSRTKSGPGCAAYEDRAWEANGKIATATKIWLLAAATEAPTCVDNREKNQDQTAKSLSEEAHHSDPHETQRNSRGTHEMKNSIFSLRF
jgi:hypothetical protein